jgi:hypothetical protein
MQGVPGSSPGASTTYSMRVAIRSSLRAALLATFAVLILHARDATAIEVACPATISVEEKAVAPGDWAADYSKDPISLDSATIFDGPPEEQASLKYDDERTSKSELIQTWRLQPSSRGYWLMCGYANTSVRVRRKLPDGIDQCEVVLQRNVRYGNGGAVIKRARCTSSTPK